MGVLYSSIYEVKELLGHSNVATTQRYAHLSNSTLLRATNMVASYVDQTLATIPGEIQSGNFLIESRA